MMMSSATGRLRVSVDPDACCSSGRCVETEPRVFDQDQQEGTVLLLQPVVEGELVDTVRLCAELCPCDAISVEPES